VVIADKRIVTHLFENTSASLANSHLFKIEP